MVHRDKRIDEYIARLPEWQQAICIEVRRVIHQADPDVMETIKFTDRPYFTADGNVCALLATKDHVSVFLYDGGIVPDPAGIITGGRENATARTIAYYADSVIDTGALRTMLAQVIANNRAGGWRKLKRQ